MNREVDLDKCWLCKDKSMGGYSHCRPCHDDLVLAESIEKFSKISKKAFKLIDKHENNKNLQQAAGK